MALKDFTICEIGQNAARYCRTALAPLNLFSTQFDLECEGDEVKVPVFGAPTGEVKEKKCDEDFECPNDSEPEMVPVSVNKPIYIPFGLCDQDRVKADRVGYIQEKALDLSAKIAEHVYRDVFSAFSAANVPQVAAPTPMDFNTLDWNSIVDLAKEAKCNKKCKFTRALLNCNAWAAFLKEKCISNHNSLAGVAGPAMKDGLVNRLAGLNFTFLETLPDLGEQLGGLLTHPSALAFATAPYIVPERNEYQMVEQFVDSETKPDEAGAMGSRSGISLTLLEKHDGKRGRTCWYFVLRYGYTPISLETRACRLVDTSL